MERELSVSEAQLAEDWRQALAPEIVCDGPDVMAISDLTSMFADDDQPVTADQVRGWLRNALKNGRVECVGWVVRRCGDQRRRVKGYKLAGRNGDGDG